MRPRLILAVAALLTAASAVCAQGITSRELPVYKSFSIEAGTGLRPLHMTFVPTYGYKEELADKGQAVDYDGAFYPVVSLTGVMRTREKTEFTLSAGASWLHHKITQYSTFGIDPQGKPRYNLNDGESIGWSDSEPIFTFTFQWRHLWNPQNAFVAYTALGAGAVVSSSLEFAALPSLTPIAFRYGGRHFYAFTELTLGTLATFVHGGIGWHF